jgi:quercetin dioxygenase-like cupin family protein
VHPGREWFYVLSGRVRLLLGEREHLVDTGQAAEFDTMTPHALAGYGGPAEVLSIFDRHGERAHLHPG